MPGDVGNVWSRDNTASNDVLPTGVKAAVAGHRRLLHAAFSRTHMQQYCELLAGIEPEYGHVGASPQGSVHWAAGQAICDMSHASWRLAPCTDWLATACSACPGSSPARTSCVKQDALSAANAAVSDSRCRWGRRSPKPAPSANASIEKGRSNTKANAKKS